MTTLILGIAIGIVVGMLIAVALALYAMQLPVDLWARLL